LSEKEKRKEEKDEKILERLLEEASMDYAVSKEFIENIEPCVT